MPRHEVIVKREFASLNPREALRIAIAIEERNANDIPSAQRTCFPNSARKLPVWRPHSLIWQRRNVRHGELLTTRYGERYGDTKDDITEEAIRDFIETPRFEVASMVEAVETGQPVRSPHRPGDRRCRRASALQYYSRTCGNHPRSAVEKALRGIRGPRTGTLGPARHRTRRRGDRT